MFLSVLMAAQLATASIHVDVVFDANKYNATASVQGMSTDMAAEILYNLLQQYFSQNDPVPGEL